MRKKTRRAIGLLIALAGGFTMAAELPPLPPPHSPTPQQEVAWGIEPMRTNGFYVAHSLVPPGVTNMPGYVEGCAWGMRYTSESTNYYIVTTTSMGFAKPPKRPRYQIRVWDDLTQTNITIDIMTTGKQGYFSAELKTD